MGREGCFREAVFGRLSLGGWVREAVFGMLSSGGCLREAAFARLLPHSQTLVKPLSLFSQTRCQTPVKPLSDPCQTLVRLRRRKP